MKSAIIELVNSFEITMNGKTLHPYVHDPANFNLAPLGGIWLNLKPV